MECSLNSNDYEEDHELTETDFTKNEGANFYFEKRYSGGYSEKIDIGNIIIETPISHFLKKFYQKTMSNYIVHRQIFFNNCTNDTNYIFLMKDDILITSDYEDEKNINPDEFKFARINPILIKIDYRQVVQVDLGDYNVMIVKFIKTENLSKLSEINLKFFCVKDLEIFHHLIMKYRVINWQKYFEFSVPINPPYMYQGHFFLQKVNSRGKNQSRLILISNKFIYNLTFDLFKYEKFILIDSVKWAIAINSLLSIFVLKKKPLTLKLNLNVTVNKKLVTENKLKFKNKKDMELLFNNENDFKMFIFHIRRLFYNFEKKNIILSVC